MKQWQLNGNEQGVTLVEMMIVLAIVVLIGTITPIVMVQHYDDIVFNKFIEQFQQDSLYAKNYAQYQTKNVYLLLIPEMNQYSIYYSSSKPLLIRPIPKQVCFPNSNSLRYYYTNLGSVSKAHTLYFARPDSCRLDAPTTRKLTMTIGHSVYYDVYAK